MMSSNRRDYRSALEWLSALRQDPLWLSQLQLLQKPAADLEALRAAALRKIGQSVTFEFWDSYQHQVEPAVMEVWEMAELSLPNLKIQTIGMLSMEWLEQHAKPADVDTPTGEPLEELNLFAPMKNLQVLLKQAWFAEVRTDAKYDATWTDGFVEALMASEYGKGIARQWAIQGARNKRNQLRAYVAGLLTDAGVLKGSYVEIANKTGLNNKERTFSTHMSRGKKQPYADWVKEYVKGDDNVSEQE